MATGAVFTGSSTALSRLSLLASWVKVIPVTTGRSALALMFMSAVAWRSLVFSTTVTRSTLTPVRKVTLLKVMLAPLMVAVGPAEKAVSEESRVSSFALASVTAPPLESFAVAVTVTCMPAEPEVPSSAMVSVPPSSGFVNATLRTL